MRNPSPDRDALVVLRWRTRLTIPATLLALALCASIDAAAQTLEIVTPANPNIKTGADIQLTVVAHRADVTVEDIVATVFDDTGGGPLASPFTFAATAAKAETATTLTLRADDAVKGTFAGKGTVILVYKGAAQGAKLTPSAPWSFSIVPVAPKISVDSRPQQVWRPVPFTDVVIDATKEEYCLEFASATSGLSVKDKTTFPGVIYTADGTKLPDIELKGVLTGTDGICLDTRIPGTYTELKGKLWLRPPDVREALDVDVDLRVKDGVGWRVLAALLATALAWLFLYWTNTVRRRLINQNHRDTMVQRIAQFVAAHPEHANHSTVISIRQAILDSKAYDEMGEFDLSATELQHVEAHLDILPATMTTTPPSGSTIVIDTDPNRLLAGKRVKFTIDKLDPMSSGKTLTWVVTKSTKQIGEKSGADLKHFEFEFRTRGLFEVSVTVDGGATVRRQVTILAQTAPSVVEKFKLLQIGAALTTLILAFGTAYLMTESAPTFGTLGDYVKLVASAFGVSSGVNSVAAIFTSVRPR